jgi:hypothetical protein
VKLLKNGWCWPIGISSKEQRKSRPHYQGIARSSACNLAKRYI